MTDRAFTVHQRYRDTGSYQKSEDEFLRWIRGPLASGIKNTGGIRLLTTQTGDDLAAIVLVSNASGVAQHEDPWEDHLAVDAGYAEYWGDAKADRPYDSTDQNQALKQSFDSAVRGNREAVPPILLFHKPERGVVQFCGLCVPAQVEIKQFRDDDGVRVPNYLFRLEILNTRSVPVEWLHARARGGGWEEAPEPWRTWVSTGVTERWPTGEQVETVAGTRRETTREPVAVSASFRAETFARYEHACALTGIETGSLLDLAHLLPRSEHPDLAEHPANAFVLNALHHRAFDAGLFTLDRDQRIRVSPTFDPAHPFLRETLLERQGAALSLPSEASLEPEFIERLNAELDWL